MIQQITVQHVL